MAVAQLVKESACNAGYLSLIPGLGRSPGEGIGYPLQYSGLENSMEYIVHGVAKSRTRLSEFFFTSLMKGLSTIQSMKYIWRKLRVCFVKRKLNFKQFFKKIFLMR